MLHVPRIRTIVSLPKFSLVKFGDATYDRDVVARLECEGYKPFYLNGDQEKILKTLNFKGVIAFQTKADPNIKTKVFDRMFIKDEKGECFMSASFCEDYLGYEDPNSKWSEQVYFLVQNL